MLKLKSSLKIGITSMLMAVFLITPVMAIDQTPENTSNDRLKLLNTYAYTEVTNQPSPELNYNENLQNIYLNMSDSEFNDAMNKHIQDVMNRQKAGAYIIWNEDFTKQLKMFNPDLCQAIESQNNVTKHKLQSRAASYTPGNADKTWYVYGNNALGIHLIGLRTRIEWAWDTTQITYALPSTTGETYAPTWSYVGIAGNTQTFYDNNTRLKKWVSGKFRSSYQGTTLEERTLSLTINIYAGGDYNPASGAY